MVEERAGRWHHLGWAHSVPLLSLERSTGSNSLPKSCSLLGRVAAYDWVGLGLALPYLFGRKLVDLFDVSLPSGPCTSTVHHIRVHKRWLAQKGFASTNQQKRITLLMEAL